jgi:hypothetical protein
MRLGWHGFSQPPNPMSRLAAGHQYRQTMAESMLTACS